MCIFFNGKPAISRPFRQDENHWPWMTLKVSTATGTVGPIGCHVFHSNSWASITCQNSSCIRLVRGTKLELFSLNYKPYVRGSIAINVRERKFQETKVPPTELSFPGTKVLKYESSMNRRRHVHSHYWSGVFNLLRFDHIQKTEKKRTYHSHQYQGCLTTLHPADYHRRLLLPSSLSHRETWNEL